MPKIKLKVKTNKMVKPKIKVKIKSKTNEAVKKKVIKKTKTKRIKIKLSKDLMLT